MLWRCGALPSRGESAPRLGVSGAQSWDITDAGMRTPPLLLPWSAMFWAGALLAASGCSKEGRPPTADALDGSVPIDPRVPFDAGSGVDARAPVDARVPFDAGSGVDARAPVDARVPTSFGVGFTDLTTPLDGMPSTFLTTPRMVPGEDPEPTVGLLADLDGDGAPEVLFAATQDGPEGRTTVAFRYDATSGLTLLGRLATAERNDRLDLMAVVDLDGDGSQDLIFNRPERELAWGLGGARFGAPSSITTNTSMWAPGYQSLLFDDFDDDGWLDVAFGIAGCCPTCRDVKLMLRDGPRSFADRSDLIAAAPAASSYAMLSATIHDARMLISIGQPCSEQDSPTFYRWQARGPDGLSRLTPFDPTPPDAYIRASDPGMGARDHAISHWVPMGTAVGDADGDGRIDLAISLNFFVGIFQDTGAFPLADHTEQFAKAPSVAMMSGQRMIPWGVALVDLDQDGRLDLFTAHGNDHAAASEPSYFIGPQYSTVHWNAGAMTFTNVTSRIGVGRQGQWRSLSVGDLDRDGDADLVVGSLAENPRVLRNDVSLGHHGFSIRLRGTTSNILGVGATVAVQVAEGQPEQVHVVGSIGSPLVFSPPMVFAGLGAATQASRVRVTWPSGLVQELRNVPAGTMHTIEEPSFIAVAPSGRHLPADGRATATVRVTPRAPDGTLRPDARVEIALAHGAGTITPARWTGTAWEATVTAPSMRGSSVVEVRVDGAAARVRPRLWWD